jgi:hypothetical protein
MQDERLAVEEVTSRKPVPEPVAALVIAFLLLLIPLLLIWVIFKK